MKDFQIRPNWAFSTHLGIGMTMKNLSYLLLVGLATPALAADPNAAKQYAELRQAYYVFDIHAYKSFSCHIDISAMDALIGAIKQAAATHPGTLQVTDSLADYSLTMDHITGLSITSPTMDIAILNEKAIADPARVKLGIQQTKDGFNKQVYGANQMIIGLFDGFVNKLPDITNITRKGNEWIVRSQNNGVADTETIDGSHSHEETGVNGARIIVDSDYSPVIDGKLAIQKTNIQMHQETQSSLTAITVTYQRLGALQVPASMVSDSTVTELGIGETKATIIITLQNCSIKD